MSYRNKTYIIFDADNDMHYYRMMQAWKQNTNTDFNFYNAHDLNKIWQYSNEQTIKKRLRERMNNAKQVVVLVGDNTKNLYKYVRWEIEAALSLDLPIIAVNLDKSNTENPKTPAILKNRAYFVSVPFSLKKIKHALDYFPAEFHNNKQSAPDPRHYDWAKVGIL